MIVEVMRTAMGVLRGTLLIPRPSEGPDMSDAGQLEFDFRGPVGDGYETWQTDWRKLQETVAEQWRLPLNRRVRLGLRDLPGEFTGELRLAARPVRLDSAKPILLKLDTMTFYSNEIETCVVEEEEPKADAQVEGEDQR